MSTLASTGQPEPASGRLLGGSGRAQATDWILGAGAAVLALAFSIAVLQTLSLRPAAVPAFFVAAAIFPLILLRPAWVVPVFIGVTWMSIGQSFFGGISPPTLGGLVLLPLGVWFARTRPLIGRDALMLLLLIGLPLIGTGLLAANGTAISSDPFKDLAFLVIAALCIRTVL